MKRFFKKRKPKKEPRTKAQMQQKINALELKIQQLEEDVKSDCFKKIMAKLNESDEVARLRKENQNLRKKNKGLKEMLGGKR